MKIATVDDVPQLVDLMAEFYAESDYSLDRPAAARAFAILLSDRKLGYVWIIESGSVTAGYLVLTLRFGMEYGGTVASLDDMFVLPRFRNAGLARKALAELHRFCQSEKIHAISVDVGRENGPAQRAYRQAGFAETDRQLLILTISSEALGARQ